MAIHDWSEDVVLVELPHSSAMVHELQEVVRIAQDRSTCSIVLDFGAVDLLNSGHLNHLVRLHNLQKERGRDFILCNVGSATRGILSITGLDGVFDIRGDRFDALATVQNHH